MGAGTPVLGLGIELVPPPLPEGNGASAPDPVTGGLVPPPPPPPDIVTPGLPAPPATRTLPETAGSRPTFPVILVACAGSPPPEVRLATIF